MTVVSCQCDRTWVPRPSSAWAGLFCVPNKSYFFLKSTPCAGFLKIDPHGALPRCSLREGNAECALRARQFAPLHGRPEQILIFVVLPRRIRAPRNNKRPLIRRWNYKHRVSADGHVLAVQGDFMIQKHCHWFAAGRPHLVVRDFVSENRLGGVHTGRLILNRVARWSRSRKLPLLAIAQR